MRLDGAGFLRVLNVNPAASCIKSWVLAGIGLNIEAGPSCVNALPCNPRNGFKQSGAPRAGADDSVSRLSGRQLASGMSSTSGAWVS